MFVENHHFIFSYLPAGYSVWTDPFCFVYLFGFCLIKLIAELDLYKAYFSLLDWF